MHCNFKFRITEEKGEVNSGYVEIIPIFGVIIRISGKYFGTLNSELIVNG